MHSASPLNISDKISSIKWNRVWIWVDGEPPWLIIVYYSVGADVNIHTTGHFLLSICAGLTHPPSYCLRKQHCIFGLWIFLWFTIWKLAATLLCPNLQVTQRMWSAMQINMAEIWRSVQQICLEAECEAKNISFQCLECSFIYQIGGTEAALGCLCRLTKWIEPYVEWILKYALPFWRRIGAEGAQTKAHFLSLFPENISHLLIDSNCSTLYLVIS